MVGTLKDRQKILQINDKAIALYHQEMNPQNNPGTSLEDPSIEEFEYRGQKINFLNFHNINAGSPVAPAWAITADHVVVGLYPQTIKAYLDRQASMAAGAKPAAADGQGKQSLADLPEIPDVVQIFRKPEDVPPIVDDVIAKGVKILWFQEGTTNPEAAEKARQAGIEVVEDRCMRATHKALIAGAADGS